MRIYAVKGRSDGIIYQRCEKDHPNAQWHVDLKRRDQGVYVTHSGGHPPLRPTQGNEKR